jgi:hypothetical protein
MLVGSEKEMMADTQSFLLLPLGLSPGMAWDVRWIFLTDMNGDGVVTISDFWLWAKWVFYAPGDFMLLALMLKAPSVAGFLEITTAMLYGWWSFALSLWVWYVLVTGSIGALVDEFSTARGTH